MNVKFLTARFKGRDEEKREITALASTPSIDRDKEIIRANAWDLTAFKKHPVLVLVHDWAKLWLGKITEITPTAIGLHFTAVFAKATAAAEEAWALIRDTGIAAFSVAFLPIASENILVRNLAPAEQKQALAAGMTLDNSVRVYTRVELMEISLCSLPSNRESLLLSWKSLAKTAELRAALEEITIEDLKPSDIKSEWRGLSENDWTFLVMKARKVLAGLERLQARLSAEKKKEIVVDNLKRSDIEKDYLANVTPEELNRMVEKALKEQVEVAIAKVRGRVI